MCSCCSLLSVALHPCCTLHSRSPDMLLDLRCPEAVLSSLLLPCQTPFHSLGRRLLQCLPCSFLVCFHCCNCTFLTISLCPARAFLLLLLCLDVLKWLYCLWDTYLNSAVAYHWVWILQRQIVWMNYKEDYYKLMCLKFVPFWLLFFHSSGLPSLSGQSHQLHLQVSLPHQVQSPCCTVCFRVSFRSGRICVCIDIVTTWARSQFLQSAWQWWYTLEACQRARSSSAHRWHWL